MGISHHPGIYLRDELGERSWSQADLAYMLGVPVQGINMIINGRRGISVKMAISLGAAFGVEPELFLKLQAEYEISMLPDLSTEDIRAINERRSFLNIQHLKWEPANKGANR